MLREPPPENMPAENTDYDFMLKQLNSAGMKHKEA
jgi:hypothetical protein